VAGVTDAFHPDDFALLRLSPDGLVDPSFGGGSSFVSTDFGGRDTPYALAIQKDGKIVLAGETEVSTNDDFALARYRKDGSLDRSFGSGGLVTTDFGGRETGYAVAVQTDGKIVAGGSAAFTGHQDFALARYQKNGKLDHSFDSEGEVTTSADGGYFDGLSIQKDGKIIAAGGAQGPVGDRFTLARYGKKGTLD